MYHIAFMIMFVFVLSLLSFPYGAIGLSVIVKFPGHTHFWMKT